MFESFFKSTRRLSGRRLTYLLLVLCAALVILTGFALNNCLSTTFTKVHVPAHAQQILAQCAALNAPAGPPPEFHSRAVSDRFELGTRPTLITNATIWTGARNGTEVVLGDILLDHGLVKAIGYIPPHLITGDIALVDARRAWVTPGLVDLHSHVGLLSAPLLAGAFDVGSPHGPVLPWLRSIDGINTHDEAYKLAIAGGVTSGQILPGSGNAIGGQAFFVKYRQTDEHSPSSMIIEPPHTLNGTYVDPYKPPRWRHMKQACGENLRSHGNRMDSAWAFRSAYDEARILKEAQDDFCRKAESGQWNLIKGKLPENLQWEMLVDVLRGRVKISNHCYEEVDLDNIVRLSNEFQFHIASFHHASEAWLVPDVLKRMWGGPPAAAIFATNHRSNNILLLSAAFEKLTTDGPRYKRESYRGSEFAPRTLAYNGIPVVMKSDHPVLNSRYLLFEAQQAHYFGLPPHLALASVTSTPAIAGGLSHRIGVLQEGADADIVLWDSHPLTLGATPMQVFIDGIPQFFDPAVLSKPTSFQKIPRTPDFDAEAREAVLYEGLPPLTPKRRVKTVVFVNVKEIWTREGDKHLERFFSSNDTGLGVVVVENGRIACLGVSATCLPMSHEDYETVDLEGGSISPGLISYGSPLGLEEISGEPSTGDGPTYSPFLADLPSILEDAGGTLRAVDALQFGTRNALLAYRAGVTVAATSLGSESLFGGPSTTIAGLSAVFCLGAMNVLESGAVIKSVTALHLSISPAYPVRGVTGPSVSTQITTLRRLLLGGEPEETETGIWFKKAAQGHIPLIIEVTNADIMGTLLLLKSEVEVNTGQKMRMSFSHATEAHILAKEISAAGVGVLLTLSRPFPLIWGERRTIPGPPLSKDTHITKLLDHNVTVGIGITEAWAARNTRFDLIWAALESNGRISRAQTLALTTSNIEKLFGFEIDPDYADLVAFSGGSVFELSSKSVAIISPGRNVIDLF